ncbi:adenylate/guanylate cyclase domain-containing protein [bacterium]|nr:adenylate/guanylate cyclase domain-containing protein [bacterium]
MALRIRILLWVSALFLLSMASIFLISDFQLSHSLTKEKSKLIERVKKIDTAKDKNILKFLSTHFNNRVQKIYDVFDVLYKSTRWRERFIPDQHNIDTKSWGASAALLSNFPFIDMINVEINKNTQAYIVQSSPYLRRYIKVPIEEDLTLFITKLEDENLVAFVGVPFWKNDALKKYIDKELYPNFFISRESNEWLLYDAKELLATDTDTLTTKNEKLYNHLFDEAITIHSKKEYNFLLDNMKVMIDVVKNKLLKHKKLISILENQHSHQDYLLDKVKMILPDIKYRRNYCIGPLCDFDDYNKAPDWQSSRSFQNKYTQKELIWELCMLTRTGIWNFSPFTPGAPKGIVRSFDQRRDEKKSPFYQNVVEGFLNADVFGKTPLQVERNCSLQLEDPEYDKKIVFQGKEGVTSSCENCCIKILYDKTLKNPFLTNTMYITYRKPPMNKANEAAITLGVTLDTILLNLALVSPDDVALIYNDKYIRLYTTDGKITNISSSFENKMLQKLLEEKRGSITNTKGENIYFTHLTKITKDDGHIILFEKEQNRVALIQQINNHVRALSKTIITYSSIVVLCALVIVIFILSQVIKAVTRPINQLAKHADHVTEQKLENIHLDSAVAKRTDEIGTLYTSFTEMIESMKEGNKVRGLLDKVVSKEIASKIVAEGVELGGEKRYLTVMFCDIRNFTSTSESMDPIDILKMLNDCLTLLSGIIEKFGGVIDKYEGDKIMTLFGAPIDTPEHEAQAVLCAIEMQKALAVWNDHREKEGYCRLDLGFGIHAGEAVAGNIGTPNHLSYTVLGHFVNVASRLCDAASGKEILVTKEVFDHVKDKVDFIENEAREFKGVSNKIVTYSILKKKS